MTIRMTDWWRRLQLDHALPLGAFVLLVLGLAWIMGFTFGRIPENLREGVIAPYDIRADREYRLVDEEATHAAHAEALKNIAPTYDFYPNKGMELAERLRHAFAEARKAGA
ncbi:MAG: hypothetical protein HY543_12195, partial [Deltaproteobacteria bacterium]|nr:hypothetical protein [Deltaproteobacteria bacterium]